MVLLTSIKKIIKTLMEYYLPNTFYKEVVGFLQKHMKDIFSNKYLTTKNRAYLVALGIAPKAVRSAHAKVRGIK